MTETDSHLPNFRQELALIASELHKDDIKNLKFLCEPSVPKKFLANFKTGLEIFEALDKSRLLSENNVSYLVNMFRLIGRIDLAKRLESKWAVNSYETNSSISPFRILLFNISEDLGAEDLDKLKFYYGKVPKRHQVDFGIDLFSYMLKHTAISPNNLSSLEKLLQLIERNDLVEVIREYQENYMLDESSMDVTHETEENSKPASCETEQSPVQQSSMYSDSNNFTYSTASASETSAESSSNPAIGATAHVTGVKGDEAIGEVQFNAYICGIDQTHIEGAAVHETTAKDYDAFGQSHRNDHLDLDQITIAVPSTESQTAAEPVQPCLDMLDYGPDDCLQYYKMTARPRGLCVIFDNHKFTYDPTDCEAIKLDDRMGSEHDRASLRKTFERLHFTVEVEENLTDSEMAQRLLRIASSDHKDYDCFVCCILSHGEEGFVHASNGRKIQIKWITDLFKCQFCPQLAGKPKLFFLQCCRGKTYQPGYQPEFEIEEDAPHPEVQISRNVIPNEADFLFGYATMADSVSYRSRSKGAFYINELTKALDKYAHREDLLTLLTRVNQEVSKKSYEPEGQLHVYKQIPAPQYTLRKLLKFL